MKRPATTGQGRGSVPFERAKVFYRVAFACFVLSILCYASSSLSNPPLTRSLHRRSRDLSTQDEECRLIHKAKDQCAFVRANCADEEAGLVSYLHFYYCSLGSAKPVAFIIISCWLGLLFSTIGIAASDFFCVNLSSIATMLGLSENLAGVTFLAFGNGSPDVFSTFAAMSSNSGSLAVGELIGAAGFITAVVAGSMAFIRPFKVAKKSFVRDVGFFIIAASFSLAFLIDGKLQLWETLSMVGLYILYVVFVVLWHWYFTRRKRRRNIEAAARSQYIVPGSGAAELGEEYQDDDEIRDLRDASMAEDLTVLEAQAVADDEDVDDDALREHFLGHISKNMRVSRARQSERRKSLNPIRPSLVGALEFRSVLSALERSRNIQSYRLHPRRRFSADDPALAGQMSHSVDDVTNNTDTATDYLTVHPVTHRPRAVSAIDASNLAYQPHASQVLPRIDLLEPADEQSDEQANGSRNQFPTSPTISISPPPSIGNEPRPESSHYVSNHLAPPGTEPIVSQPTPSVSSTGSSQTGLRVITHSRRTSETAGFPAYFDEPLVASPLSGRSPLLQPTVLPEPAMEESLENDTEANSPWRWWPGSILPQPQLLFSTLFPTLYDWKDKNIGGKLLGILIAPSVFLLTITLPVVEIARDDFSEAEPREVSPPTISVGSNNTNSEPSLSRINPDTAARPGPPDTVRVDPAEVHAQQTDESLTDDWNRWLIIVQVFTAPFFIVLIVWANTTPTKPWKLLRPTLISLLVSLVVLTFLIITTTPNRTPKWHPFLSFLGFVVSISWISTIAGEVVGVLKALGVILDISDAILGLTIFAVGNSLGDLVADVTVARLGYPVMALSACFGGPMLNILLGIGLSGSYMTISGANERHKKHPGKKLKFKPYEVEVDRTLIISGIALLITLLGLLIVVPMRRWMMDRTIGWGLILMWLAATIGNLAVEIWSGKGIRRDS